MSDFHQFEFVCRGSEKQLQVGENLNNITKLEPATDVVILI